MAPITRANTCTDQTTAPTAVGPQGPAPTPGSVPAGAIDIFERGGRQRANLNPTPIIVTGQMSRDGVTTTANVVIPATALGGVTSFAAVRRVTVMALWGSNGVSTDVPFTVDSDGALRFEVADVHYSAWTKVAPSIWLRDDLGRGNLVELSSNRVLMNSTALVRDAAQRRLAYATARVHDLRTRAAAARAELADPGTVHLSQEAAVTEADTALRSASIARASARVRLLTLFERADDQSRMNALWSFASAGSQAFAAPRQIAQTLADGMAECIERLNGLRRFIAEMAQLAETLRGTGETLTREAQAEYRQALAERTTAESRLLGLNQQITALLSLAEPVVDEILERAEFWLQGQRPSANPFARLNANVRWANGRRDDAVRALAEARANWLRHDQQVVESAPVDEATYRQQQTEAQRQLEDLETHPAIVEVPVEPR